MGLGALAGHQDLRIHPDGKLARLNAGDRAHSRHPIGADGDDLSGSHQPFVDAFPTPVGRGVACARPRSPFASETGAHEMVLGKKALEVFVRCACVTHSSSPLSGYPHSRTNRRV